MKYKTITTEEYLQARDKALEKAMHIRNSTKRDNKFWTVFENEIWRLKSHGMRNLKLHDEVVVIMKSGEIGREIVNRITDYNISTTGRFADWCYSYTSILAIMDTLDYDDIISPRQY